MLADDFKKEVMEWAEELSVSPKEIRIRKMRRKWASCSSKGRLTFNPSILNKSFEVRAKVIVHELLHLRYPIHGKMFNALLIAYLSKKGIDCNNVKF